jgi:hypothetical protein
MALIPLSKGRAWTVVDDSDYETLTQWSWHITGNGYVARTTMVGGRKRQVLMHRQITGPGPGQCVDHHDGDPLNNRRKNLRVCTQSQNMANRRKRVVGVSRYKGVALTGGASRTESWRAYIRINNRTVHLGCFATEYEAAIAYDIAAVKQWGVYAKVNCP